MNEIKIDTGSDEKRSERQRRRKLIAGWKASAKSIRESSDGSRRMLMKEARAVSLRIIEDAARTEADFRDVIAIWDAADAIEQWRLGKHEFNFTDELPDNPDYLDYEVGTEQAVIPKPFDHAYWRQLLGGNFLDYIHDCPHELQEMTSSSPVYDFMMELDGDHKEILYYWAIRYWTPQMIAAYRGQTDRNIRKVYNRMIDNLREKMYLRLYPRYRCNLPLTLEQRNFCNDYLWQLDDDRQGKVLRKVEELERSWRAERKRRREAQE
ncbi:MAG: hypothetical protein FWG42_11750 [Clostridiales bacterium]|nr:hypothetical protein [Clostridiales bacterium]